MPVDSASCFAAATAASTESPTIVTVAPYARVASVLEIEAPLGTKISHGTPRTLAAKASACAWLPADPAVTPAAAASPSSPSLASAPRTLKLPVRCRFSAFSTTVPCTRWDSAADSMTGVRVTWGAPAARAAAMRSGEISGMSTAPHDAASGGGPAARDAGLV